MDGLNLKNLNYTLPETNHFAPENGWFEYDRFFPFGGPAYLIQGLLLLVSGRVPQLIDHLLSLMDTLVGTALLVPKVFTIPKTSKIIQRPPK